MPNRLFDFSGTHKRERKKRPLFSNYIPRIIYHVMPKLAPNLTRKREGKMVLFHCFTFVHSCLCMDIAHKWVRCGAYMCSLIPSFFFHPLFLLHVLPLPFSPSITFSCLTFQNFSLIRMCMWKTFKLVKSISCLPKIKHSKLIENENETKGEKNQIKSNMSGSYRQLVIREWNSERNRNKIPLIQN